MTTKVKNLLTGEESIYVNDISLAENIVNQIILINKQTSNLLNLDLRDKYKAEIKSSISTITGRPFAFSEKYDLIATYIKFGN